MMVVNDKSCGLGNTLSWPFKHE